MLIRKRTKLETEREAPNRMKLRSDSEDPLHALTGTARDDPRRAKLRRDREDPNTEKSVTDIDSASHDTLNTERVRPK